MLYLRRRTLSFLFGFSNILHVLGVLPFITDNSSERFGLEDGEWRASGQTRAEEKWADAAFNYVSNLDCNSVFFTTGKECRKLVLIPKSQMVIHVAPKLDPGRYRAILPDEVLNRKDHFDGVLVLDPYPTANFGHLVVVFIVTSSHRAMCQKKDGIYIESSGDCLTLALKRRCKNAIKRHGRRKHHARRCEINFLPVVHMDKGRQDLYMEQNYNYLKCWKNLQGYARCPRLRPVNETKHLICNPIRDNTKRCSTTKEMVRTTCRIFEVCDQAVLISGGWNRETSPLSHKHNLESIYWMLRRNGFRKRHIKIFFANGATGINLPGEHPHQVHPAAMKLALRYHIQTLCRSPHCVNSLVLYLNSPAKNDGTVLLWDVNNDGLAENGERYLLRELKEDLDHCSAKYVHLIVDQSYAGQIADGFRNSYQHRNVIVFASGKDNEYSYGGEFTRQWATSNHTHQCSLDIYKQSKNSLKHSTPEVKEGSRGGVRSTIFGAPCNVYPPYTARELRHEYLGCQNLPTALWLKKLMKSPQDGFYRPPDDSPWGRLNSFNKK